MARVVRRHLPAATLAAKALGAMITEGRRERGWTAADLADRLGTTPPTMRRIEQGEPSVALGLMLDAAVLTGVPLFSASAAEMSRVAQDAVNRAALLSDRRPARSRPISDDF